MNKYQTYLILYNQMKKGDVSISFKEIIVLAIVIAVIIIGLLMIKNIGIIKEGVNSFLGIASFK